MIKDETVSLMREDIKRVKGAVGILLVGSRCRKGFKSPLKVTY